ncbi:long chain polyunsaturated fatty acid elongation enzyme-like protein [Leishmania tarentolae]|uniref:Elongation of fatty acids protein n=1 Tax=Leishmania tarentolae TaxID=5689 RepID=A0A640K8H3_LEITA|nr:long chain polyunsaturated fatty acid elongation enzyme-like protein [Leishmania tarentolae]
MESSDVSQCIGKQSLCFHPEFNVFVSYPVLIGCHLGYLVVIFLLRKFMEGRTAYALKYPMMLYNTAQVALSLTMAINLSPFLAFGVFNLKGHFTSSIEYWIFVHYCTKFLDMFDTYFMVLRKKEEQLSFLHIYHHLTIGFIWGFLLHHGVANGTAFFGAWINSSIHALMYFHYLYTSLGYTNPLKKFLTQLQMLQFALCILHAVLAVVAHSPIPKKWAVLQLCYHITLLYLFMQFYRKGMRKLKRKTKA